MGLGSWLSKAWYDYNAPGRAKGLELGSRLYNDRMRTTLAAKAEERANYETLAKIREMQEKNAETEAMRLPAAQVPLAEGLPGPVLPAPEIDLSEVSFGGKTVLPATKRGLGDIRKGLDAATSTSMQQKLTEATQLAQAAKDVGRVRVGAGQFGYAPEGEYDPEVLTALSGDYRARLNEQGANARARMQAEQAELDRGAKRDKMTQGALDKKAALYTLLHEARGLDEDFEKLGVGKAGSALFGPGGQGTIGQMLNTKAFVGGEVATRAFSRLARQTEDELRRRTGAALSPGERAALNQFMPTASDDERVIRQKHKDFIRVLEYIVAQRYGERGVGDVTDQEFMSGQASFQPSLDAFAAGGMAGGGAAMPSAAGQPQVRTPGRLRRTSTNKKTGQTLVEFSSDGGVTWTP